MNRSLVTDTKDPLIEIRKGNIPGEITVPAIGRSPTVENTGFTDIWDQGGIQTDITSAETWEIVSSSTADAAAGTGSRTFLISSLDADFNPQITIVTMNGQTPVVLANTHIATKFAVSFTAGSAKSNVGDITIRVSGGGDVRHKILIDAGITNNSHYTVPAGKEALATLIAVFAPKGEDAVVRTRSRPFSAAGTPSEFSPGEFPVYQSVTKFDVLASPAPFAEKTLVKFQAKSTNVDVTITTLFSILEYDA